MKAEDREQKAKVLRQNETRRRSVDEMLIERYLIDSSGSFLEYLFVTPRDFSEIWVPRRTCTRQRLRILLSRSRLSALAQGSATTTSSLRYFPPAFDKVSIYSCTIQTDDHPYNESICLSRLPAFMVVCRSADSPWTATMYKWRL